jgi:DNA-binding YbaB/EbfC family protein
MNAFKLFQNMGNVMGPQYANLMNKLNTITATGEAGGGMVKATMNANGKLLDVFIDDKLMGKDKKVIEELIVHACNNARDYSIQEGEKEVVNMAKDLPNMMEIMQNVLNNMNKK